MLTILIKLTRLSGLLKYVGIFLVIFLANAHGHTNAQSVEAQIRGTQEENQHFQTIDLFSKIPAREINQEIPFEIEDPVFYQVSLGDISLMEKNPYDFVRILLPGQEESDSELISLHKVSYQNNVRLKGVNANFETEPFDFERGVHYYGALEGDHQSMVALSVFADQLMGVVFTSEGTYEIGPIQGAGSEVYVYYRSNRVHEAFQFACGSDDMLTLEDWHEMKEGTDQPDRSGPFPCRFITVYYECDFQMHNQLGGVLGTAQYVTALHHQMNMLYAKYNINLVLNEITVWTESDPYAGIGSTGALLPEFAVQSLPFDSRLGHFLTTRSIGGGIAYLNTLCSPGLNKAVSGISLNFNDFPIYSWSTKVIAHEFGHNIGSPHTHNCFWNNLNTAIDGCGPHAGYNEGCDAPLPPNGGTIMSYCHLVSGVGVNFVEGFGDQPGHHLRNRIDMALNNPFCNLISGLTFADTVFYEACGLLQLDETTYTSSGTFLHVANPENGCFDITLIDVDIEAVNTFRDTICSGETYIVDTLSFTETGAYFVDFPVGELCEGNILLLEVVQMLDSIIVYDIDVFGVQEQPDAEYQWLDCNNNFEPIEGADYHLFLAFAEGSYAVSISRPGCTVISPCHEVVFSSVSSTDEFLNVSLSPNPGMGEFNLIIDGPGNASELKLSVQNLQGQFVYHQMFNAAQVESNHPLNLSHLPAGYYILTIRTANIFHSLPFIIIQ